MARPAIIVHGGAWNIPLELCPPHLEGCAEAARRGWEVLDRGGSALDAVVAAVEVLEDDPVFDAGRGAVLGRDGYPELDAGLMEGRDLRCGGVVAVRDQLHPIRVARAVLEDGRHCLLAGPGAELFAREHGFAPVEPAGLVTPQERANWERYAAMDRFELQRLFDGEGVSDTVGAAAVDTGGDIAVGNSTGGTSFKLPGRVGDSALPGCGCYADNRWGACCCSGWGEQIMRVVLAKGAVDDLHHGRTPEEAGRLALGRLAELPRGRGGLIILTPEGGFTTCWNTPHMAWAAHDAAGLHLDRQS